MGSRTVRCVCEHGHIYHWGDFGPDPDDGSVGVSQCEHCASERDRLIKARREALDSLALESLRLGMDY